MTQTIRQDLRLPTAMTPRSFPAQRCSARGGFSMVEVMIAITVIVIAGMGVMSGIATTNQVARTTSARDKIMMAIQDQIEAIHSWQYAVTGRTFAQIQPLVTSGSFNTDVVGVQCGPNQASTIVIAVNGAATATKLPLRITANWIHSSNSEQLVVDYVHVEH